MKYIPKFQAAGQIFASPLQNPFYGQSSAKKTTDEDAGKLVSDDMLKGLVKNGITSDVNKFTDLLISIENKYKYSSVPKAAMYKLYAYANQIVKQSDALKLAEAEATKFYAETEYLKALLEEAGIKYDDKSRGESTTNK